MSHAADFIAFLILINLLTLVPISSEIFVKTNTEDCLVYSERKVVQFYFKSNAILKLHISSMLPVTSAIQSDIFPLYL